MGETERETTRIRRFNKSVIEEFRAYLKSMRLNDTTIKRYIETIIFIGQEYLLRIHSRPLTELTAQAVEECFENIGKESPTDLSDTREAILEFSRFLHAENWVEAEQYEALQEVCKPNQHLQKLKGSNGKRQDSAHLLDEYVDILEETIPLGLFSNLPPGVERNVSPLISSEEETIPFEQFHESVLEEFRAYLENMGLKNATVNRHVDNISIFGEVYLLGVHSCPLTELTAQVVEEFFQEWYFYNIPDGTAKELDQIRVAIKKFSRFLHGENRLEETQYEALQEACKPNRPFLQKVQPISLEGDYPRIRLLNDSLLQGFRFDLELKGLKDATVDRHVQNIFFFGERYLLEIHSRPLTEITAQAVEEFFQEWYFANILYGTKKDLNQIRVAIKKFSRYLSEEDWLEVEQYDAIQKVCKPNRPRQKLKGSRGKRPASGKIFDEFLTLLTLTLNSPKPQRSASHLKLPQARELSSLSPSFPDEISLDSFNQYLHRAQQRPLAKQKHQPKPLQKSLTPVELEAYALLSEQINRCLLDWLIPSKTLYDTLKSVAMVINRYELDLVLFAVAIHFEQWEEGGLVDQLFHVCQTKEAYGQKMILLYDFALHKAGRLQERIKFLQKALTANQGLTAYITDSLIACKMQQGQWLEAYQIYQKFEPKDGLTESTMGVLELNVQKLRKKERPNPFMQTCSIQIWDILGSPLIFDMIDKLFVQQNAVVLAIREGKIDPIDSLRKG